MSLEHTGGHVESVLGKGPEAQKKRVKNSLLCLQSGFPRDTAEPGFLVTSFIEDMLSEKRREEAGQEDEEKPRTYVASGETTAPNIGPAAARGPALGTPGEHH